MKITWFFNVYSLVLCLCLSVIIARNTDKACGENANEYKEAIIQKMFRDADAVCFDVDSTVSTEEGIDVLAEYCGAGEAVREWTLSAMSGHVKFQDALTARLRLINPSASKIQSFLKEHPPKLSRGIESLIGNLHKRGTPVYLISGGIMQLIDPIAQQLNISQSHIYGNTLFFNEKGDYSGFDLSVATSHDRGKAEVIGTLKRKHGYKVVVMIGDGSTDVQAKPPADAMIGYGGVIVRDPVKKAADWFIQDFQQLIDALYES